MKSFSECTVHDLIVWQWNYDNGEHGYIEICEVISSKKPSEVAVKSVHHIGSIDSGERTYFLDDDMFNRDYFGFIDHFKSNKKLTKQEVKLIYPEYFV